MEAPTVEGSALPEGRYENLRFGAPGGVTPQGGPKIGPGDRFKTISTLYLPGGAPPPEPPWGARGGPGAQGFPGPPGAPPGNPGEPRGSNKIRFSKIVFSFLVALSL